MSETNPATPNASPRPNAGAELPLPPFPWADSVEVLLARYERQLIEHAMRHAEGVKRRAAALLKISRYALERRLTRVAHVLDGGPPPKNKARKAAAGGTTAS